MYFAYGTYQHDDNTTAITMTQRTNFGQRGKPLTVTKTLTVDGVLFPSDATQALMKTKIVAFEAAYKPHGKSAGLYHDDGTVSPHYLNNSLSIGGVRVVSLGYPEGDGTTGQYITQRTFRVVLEADFAASGDQLMAFQETLDFVGTGGRRGVLVETRTGEPQEQTLNLQTVQYITQSGSAIGYLSRPPHPPPIFPAYEDQPKRRITRGSPEYKNGEFINWPVAWSYSYQAPTALTGEPHRR